MNQVDGWVSQEFENLAHVLYDYDPYLRLEMVPPSQRDDLIDQTKVFRVINTKDNKIVLYANSLTTPQDILARVWSMDQNKNDVVITMDQRNAAVRALEFKKKIDEEAAAKDFALFVIGNQKSRWHHEGRVRDEHFRDLGPVRKHIT